jgi:2-methylisocitrate lyase-like PEP mutase family enzyme
VAGAVTSTSAAPSPGHPRARGTCRGELASVVRDLKVTCVLPVVVRKGRSCKDRT